MYEWQPSLVCQSTYLENSTSVPVSFASPSPTRNKPLCVDVENQQPVSQRRPQQQRAQFFLHVSYLEKLSTSSLAVLSSHTTSPPAFSLMLQENHSL